MATFQDLKTQDQQLADNVEGIWNQARSLGASEGAKRLELVATQFKNLSIEEAYHIINPDAVMREAEQAQVRRLDKYYVLRNGLALLPLLWTWFALFHASTLYQQDLTNPGYPDDVYQPFLKLWQEGFHGATFFTFSTAAIIDVILLLIYLLFTVGVPLVEKRLVRRSTEFATELQDTTDKLMRLIAVAGPSTTLSDNEVDKIAEAVKRTIDRVLHTGRKVAEEAQEFVRASAQQVKVMLDEFQQDVATFNTDVELLTDKLGTLGTHLQSHDQKLQELTAASTQLATSSTTLADNAKEMAASATASTQASQEAAQATQGISTQLGTLNATQQQMVGTIASTQQQVVSKIETSQRQMVNDLGAAQQQLVTKVDATQQHLVSTIASTQQQVVQDLGNVQQHIVTGIQDAADKMDEVAKDTKQVAKELGQITQADVQRITNDVANAIALLNRNTQDDVKRLADTVTQDVSQLSQATRTNIQSITGDVNMLAGNLAQINQQLLVTTKALEQAARALSSQRPKPSFIKRILGH